MLVNMKCPQCGAEISVENSLTKIFCKYCGNQMANAMAQAVTQDVQINQTVNVVHTMDRSNEPNLYINYMSINPQVMMVTRIVETGQKNIYISGQTMTFRLNPGKHVVVLKIGKINYNRTIYIPEDNQPVRINASFTGRANINIDQPSYIITAESANTGENASNGGNAATSNATPRLPKSPWAVVAFVLSFFMVTSPIAVVLGVLDLSLWRKNGKSHGLSIAAIAIGTCFSLTMIPAFSSCSGCTPSTRVYDEEVISNVNDISQKELGYIVGTYVGDDGSVLIFHSDGTCDYYFKTYSTVETEDYWMYEDNYLVWYSKDMKCNIYASIYSNNTDTLNFRSSSSAWSYESYKKVSDEEKNLTKSECDELIKDNL